SAVAGHIINVKAAPKAVVCVSAGRTIAAVGLTDSEGNVALKLAKASSAGTYTLYCSAPNYTDYESTITLAANDGQEDVVDGDGVPSDFDFDDFTHHKVLIEKYTGQGCQYCYNDDVILDNYITSFGYQNKIYEMRHYAFGDPTGPGYLRIPTLHNPLAATWGVRGFPNYLVDRGGNERFVNYEGYQKRASEIKNGNIVGSRLAKTCKVSLSLDGSTYDPKTRQLKVVVSGKLADGIPDPRLSIFITQNGFIGYQSSYGDSFEHNGVSRATITDLNGDALTPREDGVFQKTYTITLQDKYGSLIADADKMDVVAFVSSWDNYGYGTGYEKDCSDSEVYNTIDTNIAALPLKAQAPILPGSDSPVVPPTEPKEITFADGTAYNAATTVYYDKVTYTRDFPSTEWQALYVPFAINYDEWEEEYEMARIYNFIDYDDNNDGTFDRTYLVVQKLTSGSTEANMPYLIRAKENGSHSLELTGRILERAANNSTDCGSVDYDYTFTGTYAGISDMKSAGYYALVDGVLRSTDKPNVPLHPQRWYLDITPRSGAKTSVKAQAIHILVDDEEATVGIEAPSMEKSSMAVDITGRSIRGNVKGLYIVNGKKVIR
ncbi:MAG: Omp28-related outer membrane protein, partial [Bacteroidaceae bacterium]|nr:Omp28-related outer membrane protein [Bacteroidaceae bacterium]